MGRRGAPWYTGVPQEGPVRMEASPLACSLASPGADTRTVLGKQGFLDLYTKMYRKNHMGFTL